MLIAYVIGSAVEDFSTLASKSFSITGRLTGVFQDGTLRGFEPETLGRTDDGWVVEVFDTGDGVVVGTLPGAREGLAVTVAQASSSG